VKLLFTPFSIAIGLVVGSIAKKLFARIWGLVADEEAPDAKHREVHYAKLVLALLVEGAIFRLMRGFADHGLRHGFARLTGAWPGEEAPERE
jgi:Protein of unknown function (DUF4235)